MTIPASVRAERQMDMTSQVGRLAALFPTLQPKTYSSFRNPFYGGNQIIIQDPQQKMNINVNIMTQQLQQKAYLFF